MYATPLSMALKARHAAGRIPSYGRHYPPAPVIFHSIPPMSTPASCDGSSAVSSVPDRPSSPFADECSDRDCLRMPHRDLDFPYSILVADGAAARRSAIAAIFGAKNHRVVVATNGKDALNKATAQNFDL